MTSAPAAPPRRRDRRRSRGPDGGRDAGRRRHRGAPVRRHALGRPQVPAGRQGRPEPHAFRGLRRLLSPLRRHGATRSSRCCSRFGSAGSCATGPRAWASTPSSAVPAASSPTDMKAAPLLRAWLHRLRAQGVQFHMRHRWLGWAEQRTRCAALRHARQASAGERRLRWCWPWAAAAGRGWVPMAPGCLAARARRGGGAAAAVELRLRCGAVAAHRGAAGWSAHFSQRFAGQPLKSVAVELRDASGICWRQRRIRRHAPPASRAA